MTQTLVATPDPEPTPTNYITMNTACTSSNFAGYISFYGVTRAKPSEK